MGTTNCNNYNNPITLSQGGFAGTTAVASFNNVSPNATKGDLVVYSGTHNVNLAVGTDGYYMTANSGATNGVAWTVGAAVSSIGVTSSQFTIASTPITGSGTITANLPASIPGRNLLLNGDMAVWQRTTGGTGSIAVAASSTRLVVVDGWNMTTNANQATTVSQQTAATSGRYYARIQRNSGQTGISTMRFTQTLTRSQSVGIAGQAITISFVALCGANFSPTSQNFAVLINTGTGTTDVTGSQTFATGNANQINQTGIAATTSAQTFSYTSSALGSTVTQICVQFSWTPSGTAGANDWIEFSDVQLEVGSIATPFQRKSFAVNLNECIYFYQKTFNYAIAPAQAVGTGKGELYLTASNAAVVTNNFISWGLRNGNRLALTPAASVKYNPVNANANLYNLTQSADVTAGAFGFLGMNINIKFTGTLATLFGDRVIWHFQFDASL